jgi:hypothetical protein
MSGVTSSSRIGPRRLRVGELVDATLGLDEGLCERLAVAAFADEFDEVGEPALLGGQLGFLQLERVREVGAQLRDLFLNAAEDVSDVLGIGDLLLDGAEDDLLSEGPPDKGPVLACSLCGGQTAVVAAVLALTWAMVAPHEPQTMLPASRYCMCAMTIARDGARRACASVASAMHECPSPRRSAPQDA